jgi:hypothetical protein
MMHALLAALVFAFAMVPPGICACRLEALLLPEPAEHHESCPEDPDHDDGDCLRIQQDGVMASATVPASPLLGVVLPSLHEAPPSSPVCPWGSVPPFHWFDDSPLYLTLRALLL